MVWFAGATFAMVLAAFFDARRLPYGLWARFAGYLALVLGIIIEFGSQAFQGSETSLMGWFAFGVAMLGLAAINTKLAPWASAAGALFLAFGFDVLRPDPYSYVPAALLGLLVAAVAARAYLRLSGRLSKKTGGTERMLLVGYTFLIALLLYSALFKLIDRGWALPWAYLSSIGVLLFVAAQLWVGWKALLKKQITSDWLRFAIGDLGILLMTVSAFFVYREFL